MDYLSRACVLESSNSFCGVTTSSLWLLNPHISVTLEKGQSTGCLGWGV